MNKMENNEYLDKYEETVGQALRLFLRARDEVGEIMPDASDIEDKWQNVCQEYITDGVREFNAYPVVSLGWMMFIGMAVAKLWDEDWAKYSQVEELYIMLRDVRGYDCMDEYICEDVLKLSAEDVEITSRLVCETAYIAHRSLMREGFEPGTPIAFHAYVRTLHQLYLFGAAVQLKRMGYRMTKLS